MALNQQRNWDVSMAENLVHVRRNGQGGGKPQKGEARMEQHVKEEPKVWKTEPVYLPDEIIIQILEYVSRFRESQTTLAASCLLSRQWYAASVSFLYANPYLYGKNFEPFYNTICPSKNAHIRHSWLAGLVKVLDMRALVHQARPRDTARLLGRTKDNLEAFVAPVASFGLACFASLAKAHQLRILDLTLVSESPALLQLLEKVSRLPHLTTLKLPRSSGFGTEVDPTKVVWPPNLEHLSLSGGIDAHFLHGAVAFPSTLRSLTIEHCPKAKGFALMHLLRTAVRPLPNLEQLKLANLPRLSGSALDNVLLILPGLTRLSISVDYITPAVFDFDVGSHEEVMEAFQITPEDIPPTYRHHLGMDKKCELEVLELTNSGNPGVEDKVSPIDVLIAIDEGTLPNLRQVRVANSLLWHSSATASDSEALADALQEAATKRKEGGGLETGVWTFEG
ncbi:F-box domain [Lecanosticta acicola]|uniref:F-box domain n=1 Tax=Lecanosticta acicola TaxID=111012 RepID=A0AAI8W1B5_9PEZI|nr:F-box domain [Lecanosticta acicola]